MKTKGEIVVEEYLCGWPKEGENIKIEFSDLVYVAEEAYQKAQTEATKAERERTVKTIYRLNEDSIEALQEKPHIFCEGYGRALLDLERALRQEGEG